MRRLLHNILLPVIALVTIAVFVTSPQSPVPVVSFEALAVRAIPAADIQKEGSYVRSLFDAHALYTPALSVSLDRVQGCLTDLSDASAERRQLCGPLILDALTAIDLADKGRGLTPLPDPAVDRGTIQSQIAVAAIDLCRTDWLMSRNMQAVPDTPICAVANVQLVSAPQKR